MTNNDTFSFKRFGLLFKKDILENWRRYLIYTLVLYGVLSLMFMWDSYIANQYSFFHKPESEGMKYYYSSLSRSVVMILFIFGCLAASILMEPMNRKPKSISFLTQPSSSIEKFLSRWILLSVIYLIVFFVIFWFADITRILFCLIKYPDMETISILTMSNSPQINPYPIFDEPILICLTMVSLYTVVQSLFILGATFWPKNTAVKTFAAGLIIFAIYLLLCGGITSFAFEDRTKGLGDSMNLLSRDTFTIFMGTVFTVLSFVCWILAYFRFKESEIINRF